MEVQISSLGGAPDEYALTSATNATEKAIVTKNFIEGLILMVLIAN